MFCFVLILAQGRHTVNICLISEIKRCIWMQYDDYNVMDISTKCSRNPREELGIGESEQACSSCWTLLYSKTLRPCNSKECPPCPRTHCGGTGKSIQSRHDPTVMLGYFQHPGSSMSSPFHWKKLPE